MRIQETKVYQFDELSDVAKEKARDWYRQGQNEDTFWSESVIEDAATCGALFGIDINQRPVKLMGGGTRKEPLVYWQLYSQGQGACYGARYGYVPGGLAAIKQHAPQDKELHEIAKGLQDIQRRYFYKVAVFVEPRAHSMTLELEDTGERELSTEDFNLVKELLEDFAHWIFRRLEREYEWINADEQVDESIRANEYEFTEDGQSA